MSNRSTVSCSCWFLFLFVYLFVCLFLSQRLVSKLEDVILARVLAPPETGKKKSGRNSLYDRTEVLPGKKEAVSFIVKFLRNFVVSAIFLGKREQCRLSLAYNSERLCVLVNVLHSLEVLRSGRTYVIIAYNLGILLVFTERA